LSRHLCSHGRPFSLTMSPPLRFKLLLSD
jgi:hypothetical protein